MKEFIIFVCIDSTEIFFSKLRSAGLNYNLPSFFTESYCAGVSNKHCLLTFFILIKSQQMITKVSKYSAYKELITCRLIKTIHGAMCVFVT